MLRRWAHASRQRLHALPSAAVASQRQRWGRAATPTELNASESVRFKHRLNESLERAEDDPSEPTIPSLLDADAADAALDDAATPDGYVLSRAHPLLDTMGGLNLVRAPRLTHDVETMTRAFADLSTNYHPPTYAYCLFDATDIVYGMLTAGFFGKANAGEVARWLVAPHVVLQKPAVFFESMGKERAERFHALLLSMLEDHDAFHSPLYAAIRQHRLDAGVWVPFCRGLVLALYRRGRNDDVPAITDAISQGMVGVRAGLPGEVPRDRLLILADLFAAAGAEFGCDAIIAHALEQRRVCNVAHTLERARMVCRAVHKSRRRQGDWHLRAGADWARTVARWCQDYFPPLLRERRKVAARFDGDADGAAAGTGDVARSTAVALEHAIVKQAQRDRALSSKGADAAWQLDTAWLETQQQRSASSATGEPPDADAGTAGDDGLLSTMVAEMRAARVDGDADDSSSDTHGAAAAATKERLDAKVAEDARADDSGGDDDGDSPQPLGMGIDDVSAPAAPARLFDDDDDDAADVVVPDADGPPPEREPVEAGLGSPLYHAVLADRDTDHADASDDARRASRRPGAVLRHGDRWAPRDDSSAEPDAPLSLDPESQALARLSARVARLDAPKTVPRRRQRTIPVPGPLAAGGFAIKVLTFDDPDAAREVRTNPRRLSKRERDTSVWAERAQAMYGVIKHTAPDAGAEGEAAPTTTKMVPTAEHVSTLPLTMSLATDKRGRFQVTSRPVGEAPPPASVETAGEESVASAAADPASKMA